MEAILDGTIPVEMQDRYLNIVLSETERLEKLTKGLLTLNTFDGNGYLMEMSDFDINEVIRKSWKPLKAGAMPVESVFCASF